MDHTITLTEEQRHEVACSINTQIRRIEQRMSRQARKTLQGGRINATVFVKSSTNNLLDGLIRASFTCEVHPVGRPVWPRKIAAFFPWDAANRALAAWEAARLEGQI